MRAIFQVMHPTLTQTLRCVRAKLAARASRSRAELICRELGLDYDTAARLTGLSQGDSDAVLVSGVFDRNFYVKADLWRQAPEIRVTFH
jgi:hypothetical protein